MNANLEKIRNITKKKILIMSLSTTLPIIIFVGMRILHMEFKEKSLFHVYLWLPYVLVGVFEAYLIYKIIKYIRIMKDDEFANQIILKKTDERNKFIRLKAASLSYKIFLYVMGIFLIISSLIDYRMCIAIGVVFIAFILIHLIVNIYYASKTP
ncbi:MAG: hypothetical protein K5892_02570, partial [Acholeplasmatales bacterium]|nr:hypothetical protein [Acholeplasmatales bacterium]